MGQLLSWHHHITLDKHEMRGGVCDIDKHEDEVYSLQQHSFQEHDNQFLVSVSSDKMRSYLFYLFPDLVCFTNIL